MTRAAMSFPIPFRRYPVAESTFLLVFFFIPSERKGNYINIPAYPSVMFAAKVSLKEAEQVKRYIIRQDGLHPDFLPIKEFGFLIFPLRKKMSVPKAEVFYSKMSFPSKPIPITIEALLKDKLSKKELSILPKSQEIVGKIMILEIPAELTGKQELIAEAYLELNKNIETVVKKEHMHEGVFRTRRVKVLAGKLTKKTVHLESGVKISLHLEKNYFSARSANERLRIASLIKPGEEVLVMFSGAGPYLLVLKKRSAAQKIYGIELNTLAHFYALNNVTLNNLDKKIVLYGGDVRTVLPSLKKTFDRIVMPLPKTSEEYLDVALPALKKK